MDVDVTLRCAVTTSGEARPGAAREDGIVCKGASADIELKYAELLAGDRCRLIVVALETGGRWSPEALEFVEGLARARAREAVRLFGSEEKTVMNAFRFQRNSVCHFLAVRATGAARRGWGHRPLRRNVMRQLHGDGSAVIDFDRFFIPFQPLPSSSLTQKRP